MLRSTELLQSPPARAGHLSEPDPVLTGLTADSRLVQPGFLFVALQGTKTDGRRFVAAALENGARAVLTDEAGLSDLDQALPVPVFIDHNPRRKLAQLAAIFYGAQPAITVAITGTNGKTSTASFIRQIWADAGLKSASIGTLGVERSDGLNTGSMTTPDPVTLHATLAALVHDGINYAAMEASSHGIDQYRLDGVTLTAAAFTNLTQDHLDYHGTMDAYFAAKHRLFTELLPSGSAAILNADIPEFQFLAATAKSRGHRLIDYGYGARFIRLVSRHIGSTGQTLNLEIEGQAFTVALPLIGEFQAINALAALGLALGTGVAVQDALDALSRLQGVRGRLEHVTTSPNDASIYVDYAHTPDGLDKVLRALRPHTTGKLICVFGAGGDRDPTKRPKMGAIVARLADLAIVTDDNPRSEIPASIRAAILIACPEAIEIGDRRDAIAYAMSGLDTGDVLVIAGKGHEQGQAIDTIVHPFDDASVARTIAQALWGHA